MLRRAAVPKQPVRVASVEDVKKEYVGPLILAPLLLLLI